MKKLTYARLREVLHYDPDTGIFTWLIRTANRNRVGGIAGTVDPLGYRRIIVDNEAGYGHRLAWLYMTGEWPVVLIDHRDLNNDNNRWDNLREATHGQNKGNVRRYSSNTSGYKGVTLVKKSGRWHAQIAPKGKNINLGYYDCPVAAHLAYIVAADTHFGEFARAA